MNGVLFVPQRRDRQRPGGLVADDQVAVLIKDLKTLGLMSGRNLFCRGIVMDKLIYRPGFVNCCLGAGCARNFINYLGFAAN